MDTSFGMKHLSLSMPKNSVNICSIAHFNQQDTADKVNKLAFIEKQSTNVITCFEQNNEGNETLR